MAGAVITGEGPIGAYRQHQDGGSYDEPFVGARAPQARHSHRYSSHFDPEMFTLGAAASPGQTKRTLEAHLTETERRLQDTQKLGQSLLQQQTELTVKIREVETQQDEFEVSPELRERLAELEQEYNDVGKELARATIGPKSRAPSGEEKHVSESAATFTSNTTGSPTKTSAPSRKQRNQPTSRVGDIQFAADISTNLLAQVRQMQGLLAERDEALKNLASEKSRLEHEAEGFGLRMRAHDESEQRYKDENWNLEAQAHELLTASRESADRERKLNASLAAALAEKSRAQDELDEVKVVHEKLASDHAAAKKAYDSELHGLKRNVDVGEDERDVLKNKIDELTMQNQELAHAMAVRFRSQNLDDARELGLGHEEVSRDHSTPEHSPPPSPTKATPRHGGLESETLKSSLHHAHRMIQNLKGNIHREKTEKIELKRMLQDARDELEQRRADGGVGSGSKRQKTKSETFRKPLRPDMLGVGRRTRTDVELEDDQWEDHAADSPSQRAGSRHLAVSLGNGPSHLTDVSDAYHTANETEGAFETADERHGTESEDFQTGAESLAGDSTDELTETEDNAIRKPRSTLAFRPAGNRTSYLSTASTSAGEDEDNIQTPVQMQPQKFRLKNGRTSFARQTRLQRESTPDSFHAQVTQVSPAGQDTERSPPAAEQSLFAELNEFDDTSSDRYSTPGGASIVSQKWTPATALATGALGVRNLTPSPRVKPFMVDSSTMTDPWSPENPAVHAHRVPDAVTGAADGSMIASTVRERESLSPSPSDFLPPESLPKSPPNRAETSKQYTPRKSDFESPARSIPSFITPPKTVWDEAQSDDRIPGEYPTDDATISQRQLGFSGLLAQDTTPLTPEKQRVRSEQLPSQWAYSSIQAQESAPVPIRYDDSPTLAAPDLRSLQPKTRTPEGAATSAATGGILASAAAVLGFSRPKDTSPPVVVEDETSAPTTTDADAEAARNLPLQEVSGNTRPRQYTPGKQDLSAPERGAPLLSSSNDQGSQTLLTSEQIEAALQVRKTPALLIPPILAPTAQSISPQTPQDTARSGSRARETSALTEGAASAASVPASKRPSSATSTRPPSFTTPRPPLPSDHKTLIARASSTLISPSSTTPEPSSSSHVANIMGPPIAPASAYRRPRTPVDSSIRSTARDATTPRAHRSRVGGTVGSQRSRRSSVSSFESELDARFNIRADAGAASHGFEPSANTDPRMIQAITQTMIGEYLWKYTRKPGSTDMSSTRHRRYFWVHPYTKTLYWSDRDPQSAGRNELKAKSVQISSVRVISDDNPNPPGLHRKSLEIVAPGRKVKITASTGQRHETWFAALSYLLLRGEEPHNHGAYAHGGNEITDADVDEFNVGGYGRNRRSRSRASVSSYNSRGTSANRSTVRVAQPIMGVATRGSNQATFSRASLTRQQSDHDQPTLHPDRDRMQDKDRTLRTASVSRFSKMIGSMTGSSRRGTRASEVGSESQHGRDGSIYDASVVSDGRRDSEEEMRREMSRQEQERDGAGLENVRACCDGKHDVSTLNHAGRHASHSGHAHRPSNMERLSQSLSRRPVGTLTGPSVGTERTGTLGGRGS